MLASTAGSIHRHTAVGKPLLPLSDAAFPYGYRDLPLHQASCRTFSMSRATGQYIVFGSGSTLYLSRDYGKSFSAQEGAVSAGTSAYQSLVSDDGQVIVIYGVTTGNSFQVFTNGLQTAASVSSSLGTSTTFTVRSICMSGSGQYIFVSGNGSDGGLFVSANFGTSFSRSVSASAAQACDCSPSGALVVLALDGAAPQVSSNYGYTFASKGTTAYAGRRVYVHPDETYFAMRTTSSIVYVDLSVANTTKLTDASPSYTLNVVTASDVLSNTAINVDSSAALDQNGRLYYISSGAAGSNAGKVCYGNIESKLSAETPVPNFEASLFSGSRICVTVDGKYILGFTGTTLRLLKQFHASNLLTFQSTPTIWTTGNLVFSYYSAAASSLPLALSWTPRTSASQPQSISLASQDVNLSGLGFAPGKTYVFTLASLTGTNGLINGRATLTGVNNIPVPVVTDPAGLTVLSTSNSVIYLSWTASTLTNGTGLRYIVNASLSTTPSVIAATMSVTSTSCKLTGLSASKTYKCTVQATCDQEVNSAAVTIDAQTLSGNVKMSMTLISTSYTTPTYADPDNYLTDTTNINYGENLISRTNGITVSTANTKSTYLNLSSLSKTLFQSNNITFYMKFKMVSASNNDRCITFCVEYPGSIGNFLNVAVVGGSGNKKANYAYYDPGKIYDLTTANFDWATENIHHLFISVSSSGSHRMTMLTNSKVAVFNATGTVAASSVFNSMATFDIGRTYFSSTLCTPITVYFVNTYAKVLTNDEMNNLIDSTNPIVTLP